LRAGSRPAVSEFVGTFVSCGQATGGKPTRDVLQGGCTYCRRTLTKNVYKKNMYFCGRLKTNLTEEEYVLKKNVLLQKNG
jgi:hypothetical protein